VKVYSRSHLAGRTLLAELSTHLSEERGCVAEVLADIGEIDARGLYRASGYPSMYAFCVGKCHFTHQAALKRIYVARVAREYPILFEALAAGRLHMAAVALLASHFTSENVGTLVEAATHKSKFEIQRLIAERAPRPDVPTRVTALQRRSNSLQRELRAGSHLPRRALVIEKRDSLQRELSLPRGLRSSHLRRNGSP
jgi:hypothetical protein